MRPRESTDERQSRIRIPLPPELRPGISYPLSFAVPLAIAALQHELLPKPSIAPFVLLYLGVAVVSWLAGTGPGLIATPVSAALGNALFIEPHGAWSLSPSAVVATALFMFTAAMIAALAGSLHTALHAARRSSQLARRYQLLAANSRDIVLLVRPDDGRILEANAAALAAYGYDAHELLAKNIRDLRADPSPSVLEDQLRAANDEGVLFEALHRRKDGSVFPVEVSSQGGTVGGERAVVSVIRDITERKRAEESLRQSERRVRAKLESIVSPGGDAAALELEDLLDVPALQALVNGFYELSGIPMSIINLEGKVLVGAGWQDVCTRYHRVNAVTCAHCIESDTELTVGIRPGEFRRYRCKNNMWDASTPIVVGERHVGNILTGQFFFDDEVPDYDVFRRQAREYRFDEDQYLAALDRAPRLSRRKVNTGLIFLSQLAEMLSKLGHANVRLARSVHERDLLTASLQETDRNKNQFIAMLSHELRNPLTPVRNSLYILGRAAPGGEQARRALAVIDRQTAHLSKLIDDLLDVTRIAHGKIRLQRAQLRLDDLVRQVADDHRDLMADRSIELFVEVPESPVEVDGDRTRLEQAIGNLLGNAAKFSERGRVVVSLSTTGAQAEVRVRDSGVGIPAEVLPRLFQPFVQGETTIDRSKGGLGLGLAVSKSLAELHGGTLSARSDGTGKGAEFTLRLPLARGAAAATAEHRTSATGGRRILLIDDLRDAVETLRDALEMNRHDVEVAYTGLEGVEKARAFRPEVVLCDIGLPGMDGFAVARALRADPSTRGALLVALTGYASADDKRAALDAGFDFHLAKPLDFDAVQGVLEERAPSSH